MQRVRLRFFLFATAAAALLDCGRSDFISHADPPERIDVQAGRRSATVRWEKVPGASGYRIYGAANSLVAPSNFAASGGSRLETVVTSAQFLSLTDSQDWFFAVQSVKDGQGGALSARVQVRPLGLGTNATRPTFGSSTRIDGAQNAAHFGYTVDGAGDVNGDGYTDIIVGTPNWQNGSATNAGRAEIFLGGSAGISTVASWMVESNVQDAFFGIAAAGVGDLNHDGYDDLLVCSPNWLGGEALVYLGRAAGPLTTYSLQIPAPVAGTFFGFSCAGIGDVNHDGYDDIAVGAPGENNVSGAVYVYLGGPTGLLHSEFDERLTTGTNLEFGYSIAGAGDVDGDGMDDLLVGANNSTMGSTDVGHAYLFRGSAAGLSTAASWTAAGDQVSGLFGYRVSHVGDLDGDGHADLAVGSFLEAGTAGAPNTGRAAIYFGTAGGIASSRGVTLDGSAGEQFALSAKSAGDLDGDGTDDLLIGGLAFNGAAGGNSGRALLYSGGVTAGPLVTLEGPDAGDLFGYSASGAGDVNADGSPDFIVSGFNAGGASQAGAVWVFYGPPHDGPRANAGALLSGTPDVPLAPVTAEFSDVRAGSPWSCTWDFGDGVAPVTAPCTPASVAVSHTFGFAGVYDVRLTVTNVFGLSGQSLTKARIGSPAAQAEPAAAARPASPKAASSSARAESSRR